MSESEAAVDRGDNLNDACPICLEPLPPFWQLRRQVSIAICCGNEICKDCHDKRNAFLLRRAKEGSISRDEEQLDRCCLLCRSKIPDFAEDKVRMAKVLVDKFENGHLPLKLYELVGKYFINGALGVEKDVRKGMNIFMLGAEKGNPICQFWIGHCYHDGLYGLSKCPQEAKRLLLAAAEQGHPVAEHTLAETLRDEGDSSEYLRLLRGSASKGYDLACYDLGLAHYNGEYGLQQSIEEAIRALTPAVKRGDVHCMHLLGEVMVNPDPDSSVEPWDNPNFTKGMHWVRRAAETGHETDISQLSAIEKDVCGWCFTCKKKAPPVKAFLRCSRCCAAWYCSKECQRRHWKAEGGHKQFCIKW